ncbi:plexin domain containing lethal (1) G0289 [Nomia melanderi]|uniref:plexin domain containing lethal (1) G0289 n=1 Tax=Nomia melanderi TaxID=2448451 RepID=UPI00130416E6|nr:plexin domain-containing protein 2-like [Nomia melanderi]
MACERWCFNRGCDGAIRGWPCVLLLLAFYVFQPSIAANEFNGYHYYELDDSKGHSSAEYGPIEFSYVSNNQEPVLDRVRRAADDKSPVMAQQSSLEQMLQQPLPPSELPYQQSEQPATQSESQQQQQKQLQQQQPQQQQQQQLQQQQQQQQSQVTASTSNAPANVSYSTDTGESSTVSSAPTTSKAKQDASTIVFVRPFSYPTKPNNKGVEAVTPSLKPVTPVNSRLSNVPNKSVPSTAETMSDTTDEKEDSDGNIGDISIGKFSDFTNKTLSQHNITKMVNDTHQYYNSTFFFDKEVGKKYWVDMDNHPDLKVNVLLSQSHRRATTVKLKFDFPFYGHKVRNITIATGGFLYTGEYVHSWLAATQYIAPLMANFDTRLSNDSYVKYADNGTAFTVEWEKVILQDKPEAGAFTFQVTLHQNGDIVFVYSVIPLMIGMIEDTSHPVKVGLSDAYIMDRIVFFVRRKTIYEYHRVNFNRQDIKSWTVIYLNALPTCLEMDNCKDCLTKLKDFNCKWCSALNQCSTGMFRSRQDWLLKGCDVRKIKEVDNCPLPITYKEEPVEEFNHVLRMHPEETVTVSEMNVEQGRHESSPLERSRNNNMNMGVSGIIGILMVVGLVVGMVGWAAYAYRNPHSASGQILIRYRPSQWSWRRGEARYTAATIHM